MNTCLLPLVRQIDECINTTYSSKSISTIFANFKGLGNAINQGTAKGSALAVNPSILSLAKTTKDNSGKSLTSYLTASY
jgi:hypothetical protein